MKEKHFRLSEKCLIRISKIQYITGETPIEIIRSALQLFEYLINETRKGNQFFIGKTLTDLQRVRLFSFEEYGD